MELIISEKVYPSDYNERMAAYNNHVMELEIQRQKFLKENPNHPFKDIMFLNVIAPPQKCIIRDIKII